MAKADVVAAAVAAVQAGQVQVLNDQFSSVFDQAEAIGTGPGFTQADIDAAVKAAVDPLNASLAQDQVDEQALKDANAAASDAMAALQKQFDDLSVKEAPEASLIASLQSSKVSLQAALDALNAALNPAPAA